MHAQGSVIDVFLMLGSLTYVIQFVVATALLIFEDNFSNRRQYLIAIVPWFILAFPLIYLKLKSFPK